MQRQIFRVERIYSYPLQIVVRIPKKRTYRRDSINTLNATLVSFACDATMNFLLCDTYMLKCYLQKDITNTLRCIIIINEFISLKSPMSHVAFKYVEDFAQFNYFLRLSIISYCLFALLNNCSMSLRAGTYHKP